MSKEKSKMFASLLGVAALTVMGADVSAQQTNETTSFSDTTKVKGKFVFQKPAATVDTTSNEERITEDEKNLLAWVRSNISSPLIYSSINRAPQTSLIVFQRDSNIEAHFHFTNLLRFRGHKVKITLFKVDRSIDVAVSSLFGPPESQLERFAVLEEFSEPAKLTVAQIKDTTVSQLGEADLLFDGLSAASEYAALVSFPDTDTEVSTKYLVFNTSEFSLFQMYELNTTASTVSFRINSARLRDFLVNEQEIQVLAAVRKQSLDGSEYPWVFTPLTADNFVQRRVKLTALESGTDYDVALFAHKDNYLAQLTSSIPVKTKTAFEIKESPFVRAQFNRHGVLEVDVDNLFWRNYLAELLNKSAILPIGEQRFDPKTGGDLFEDDKVFELRGYVYQNSVAPTLKDVSYQTLGLVEDLQTSTLILDSKVRQNFITQRQTVKQGSGKLRFELTNLPPNSEFLFSIFEVLKPQNSNKPELYVPLTSKHTAQLAKSLEGYSFVDLKAANIDLSDVAFQAVIPPKLQREVRVLTHNSAQLMYRYFVPDSNGHKVVFRPHNSSVTREAQTILTHEGLLVNFENLQPDTEYIVEIYDSARLVSVTHFKTLDLVHRIKSKEKITSSRGDFVFGGLKQFEGLKIRVQLLDDKENVVFDQEQLARSETGVSFANLLPASTYTLKVINNDFSQEEVLHQSTFSTQRSYAVQFTYEGRNILFFAPHEEDLLNQTSTPHYLATPMMFEYRIKDSDTPFTPYPVPVPDPVAGFLTAGTWVNFQNFKASQTYEYIYSFIKEGKKVTVASGEFSTLVNHTPFLTLRPIQTAVDQPLKFKVILTTAVRSNTTYKVVYSPVLSAEYYKKNVHPQTVFPTSSPVNVVAAEAKTFEREFVFNPALSVNNNDGTVTFEHELFPETDIIPGVEYSFVVYTQPTIVPGARQEEVRNSWKSFLLSSPQSANVTNVTLTDLNPAPDLLLTSKYRLSSSFVSPPNNGIFVSKDSKGKHFVLIRLLSRLFDVNNLNTKYYLHVASYKNDLNTSLEADPLPIKEYAVDVLPESLSEVDSFGQGGKVIYRVAALNLEELDPKLNYVFRLVQLAQESSEKVTKTKPELLKEILLASPLATYSLSSELVSKIYEDKTEIPHKTTIRRSRDHLLPTTGLPPLTLASPNGEGKSSVRVARNVVELDLDIPAFYVGTDRILEVRVIKHDSSTVPLDSFARKSRLEKERLTVDFNNAITVKRILASDILANKHTLSLTNLEAGSRYSLAVFDSAQPTLPIFEQHNIQTVDPEVQINFTSAKLTFTQVNDQHFYSEPNTNKAVYFLISADPNFVPSQTHAVLRRFIGKFSDFFDVKTVRLVGLKPDTTYYYALAVQEEDVVNRTGYFLNSKVSSFHTPPAPKISVKSVLNVRGQLVAAVSVSNLASLGAIYSSQDGVTYAPLRVEFLPRSGWQTTSPRISRWTGLSSRVFNLKPTTEELSFLLNLPSDSSVFDLLFVASNPIVAATNDSPHASTDLWMNLANNPLAHNTPEFFVTFKALVHDLKNANFFHESNARWVDEYGLLNLNGSVFQQQTSPRRGLEFLDLPSNYYVNNYFDTSASYDYSPVSTFTFNSKVNNVVPIVQADLTAAKLFFPTFNNRNLFNTLAVLSFWKKSTPYKKFYVRAALTLTNDIVFELAPLEPDTEYVFQVLQDNVLLSSGSFSTPKLTLVEEEPTKEELDAPLEEETSEEAKEEAEAAEEETSEEVGEDTELALEDDILLEDSELEDTDTDANTSEAQETEEESTSLENALEELSKEESSTTEEAENSQDTQDAMSEEEDNFALDLEGREVEEESAESSETSESSSEGHETGEGSVGEEDDEEEAAEGQQDDDDDEQEDSNEEAEDSEEEEEEEEEEET